MRLSLRSFMTFALIGTAAAVPAFAQSSADTGGPSSYPACTGKPTQADTDAAHGAYMAGKGSFDEADYTTAVNYFRDAYRRDCTKHELLAIIARAYELQGNRREAVHALETYLERVPNAQDAEVQRRHIANLKRELTDAAVRERLGERAAARFGVGPASGERRRPAPSASAAPTPSATSSVRLRARAAPKSRAHDRSVGRRRRRAASRITGGVLYGVGSGQVSSAEAVVRPNAHVPAGNSSAISQGNTGRTNETIGVVVGGLGLAAVAGGLIWHFVEPTGPASRPKSRRVRSSRRRSRRVTRASASAGGSRASI